MNLDYFSVDFATGNNKCILSYVGDCGKAYSISAKDGGYELSISKWVEKPNPDENEYVLDKVFICPSLSHAISMIEIFENNKNELAIEN